MNPSENIVYELSQVAFLKLWTHVNPLRAKDRKELCDILVVCQPDMIIFSVKHSEYQTDQDPKIARQRWKRHAISESIDQIYGAQRYLDAGGSYLGSDGERGVDLGPPSSRRIHRVAIAIGSNETLTSESMAHAKGFVHVFDDRTIEFLTNELDTISDFVGYLDERERLLVRGKRIVQFRDERDLVARFLSKKHSLVHLMAEDVNLPPLDLTGAWDAFSASTEYAAKKADDVLSYAWDRLIDDVHMHYSADDMQIGGDLDTVDLVTRTMARENRVQRRILGSTFDAFLRNDRPARISVGFSSTGYVFVKMDADVDRKYRQEVLQARCIVAREIFSHSHPDITTIVGLATEIPSPDSGFSLDCVLLHQPTWTAEASAHAKRIQEELGYFKNTAFQHRLISEYRTSKGDFS